MRRVIDGLQRRRRPGPAGRWRVMNAAAWAGFEENFLPQVLAFRSSDRPTIIRCVLSLEERGAFEMVMVGLRHAERVVREMHPDAAELVAEVEGG